MRSWVLEMALLLLPCGVSAQEAPERVGFIFAPHEVTAYNASTLREANSFKNGSNRCTPRKGDMAFEVQRRPRYNAMSVFGYTVPPPNVLIQICTDASADLGGHCPDTTIYEVTEREWDKMKLDMPSGKIISLCSWADKPRLQPR